jgi:phospholipid-binding lipoprotein MlaA
LDKYTFVRDAYLQRRAYLIESDTSPRRLPVYEDGGGTPGEPGAGAVVPPGTQRQSPALPAAPAPPPAQQQQRSPAVAPVKPAK